MQDEHEVLSLNIDELNIEELEQRLELAGAAITPYGYTCGVDNAICAAKNVCGTKNPK